MLRGTSEFFYSGPDLCTRDFGGRLIVLDRLHGPLWTAPPGTPLAIKIAAIKARRAANPPAALQPLQLDHDTLPTLAQWQYAFPRGWNYRPTTPAFEPGGGRRFAPQEREAAAAGGSGARERSRSRSPRPRAPARRRADSDDELAGWGGSGVT